VDAIAEKPTEAMAYRGQEIETMIKNGDWTSADAALGADDAALAQDLHDFGEIGRGDGCRLGDVLDEYGLAIAIGDVPQGAGGVSAGLTEHKTLQPARNPRESVCGTYKSGYAT
jgi:hypothetical protein